MDFQKFTQAIMNPVRLRIVQYLMTHKTGTAADFQNVLPDIPQASLYRHIKKLYEANCIAVVKETNARGAVKKTYSLSENPLKKDPTNSDVNSLICWSLMSLQHSFVRYFENENADPQKDMLFLQTSTLMLNDAEFAEILQKIGEIVSPYISNIADNDRKPRRITFISSPDEEQQS